MQDQDSKIENAATSRPTCSCGKTLGERDTLERFGKISHGPECCTCPSGSRVHRATCPATTGEDEPQHSRACLAAAMICAVQNVRDDESSDLATADLYGIALGYLVDELTACHCEHEIESDLSSFVDAECPQCCNELRFIAPYAAPGVGQAWSCDNCEIEYSYVGGFFTLASASVHILTLDDVR